MTITTLSRRTFNTAAVGIAASVAAPAWAQPAQTLRIISPYGAGGTGDVLARSLGDRLAAQMKKTVIVDNKPGAGGSLGLQALIQAPADGQTICLVATSPITVLPHLQKLRYNPEKDIQPIAPVMISPVVILATSNFKGKTIADLVAEAKKRPGEVSLASTGLGTVGHILIESLADAAGVRFLHVPYKAAGQTLTDGMAGIFDVLVANPFPGLAEQIKLGRFRMLAIAAPTRASEYPNVPTLAEAGFKSAQVYSTYGVVGPAGLTAEQVSVLNREINTALQTPELKATIAANDGRPAGGRSTEYVQALRTESAANARIIRPANIRLD